jgi:hypothetical protein
VYAHLVLCRSRVMQRTPRPPPLPLLCCPRPAPCCIDARVVQISAALLAVAGAPATRTGPERPCSLGRFWTTLPGRWRRPKGLHSQPVFA